MTDKELFQDITDPKICKLIDKMLTLSEFIHKKMEKRQNMNVELKKLMDEKHGDDWEEIDFHKKKYLSTTAVKSTHYMLKNIPKDNITKH